MNNVSFRLKCLLGGILILVLGLGVWGMWQQKEAVHKPSRAVGEEICPTCPVVIKGISAQELKGGKLVYSFKADEFKINPRAYGVFLFQPIKEATLINAFMEVYLSAQGNSTQEVDLFPSSLPSAATSSSSDPKAKRLSTSGIGVITRLVFKNLHLNIYKGEVLTITIVADEAFTNLSNKETVFKGVQIEHKPSRKFISTRSATWDAREKVFKIPGEYIAVTPKGKAKAYGIKVNLDFKVKKIPS
jgi:hypothetical protein